MRFYIKEARERVGLSQKDLAEKLNLKPTTFNGYETGAHDPKSNILAKIATELHTTTDYLLGLTNNPEMPSPDHVFSAEYINLANKYRRLDVHGKDMVNLVLDKESDRCENEYIELVARGGKYKVKKADVIEWAKQLDSKDCEEDRDLF